MLTFLRNLFGGSSEPATHIPVSLQMRMMVYARLDRLARHSGIAGDSIVNIALTEWLDKHEDDILNGRVVWKKAA